MGSGSRGSLKGGTLKGGQKYKTVTEGLIHIYKDRIRPLEKLYSYERFHSPALADADIKAKPMVLLLGQYSTGKTTFVQTLLGTILSMCLSTGSICLRHARAVFGCILLDGIEGRSSDAWGMNRSRLPWSTYWP